MAHIARYVCHSVGHLSHNCPNRPSGGNDKGSNQATWSRAQVNCCTTAQCMPECDVSVAAKECAVSIDESVCESVCESVWEYGCFPVIEAMCLLRAHHHRER